MIALLTSHMQMGCAAQERTAKQKTPQNTVNLQTSTVKADAEDPKDRDLKYCFRVVSRDRMYLLQACLGL